jgi:putative PIN family toxin of toxin-antitoxin system
MRVLFDTNVLLSAFITDGLCAIILLRARNDHFELFSCPFILKEFGDKLHRKFSATQAEIREAIHLLLDISVTVDPKEKNIKVRGVCRDKRDDNVLSCARAAEVDYIVSGDPDLLIMKKYRSVRIINPRTFELLFKD